MPKYFYLCNQCETKHSFYHGMDETVEKCPSCDTKVFLEKVPSFISLKKQEEEKEKTGQLVKNSIDESKEELKKQKNKLRSKFYDDNE